MRIKGADFVLPPAFEPFGWSDRGVQAAGAALSWRFVVSPDYVFLLDNIGFLIENSEFALTNANPCWYVRLQLVDGSLFNKNIYLFNAYIPIGGVSMIVPFTRPYLPGSIFFIYYLSAIAAPASTLGYSLFMNGRTVLNKDFSELYGNGTQAQNIVGATTVPIP